MREGRSSSLEIALVASAATVLALFWTWPLARAAADRLAYFGAETPGITADGLLVLWSLAWATHALATNPLGLFHANSFFPAPASLAYSEHFLGAQPLFAPTYLATGNGILALNLFALATYPLCAAAMYALARRWTAPPAALVAALAFAFTATRRTVPPYVYMLSVQWLPLAILFTERWLADRRTRDLAIAAGALCLQMLTSYYLAYAALFGYAAYLAIALAWRGGDALRARTIAPLAVAIALAAAPAAALSLPYLEMRRLGLLPSYGAEGGPELKLVQLMPYFATRRVILYWTSADLGPIALALAALALVPPWGRRALPAAVGVALAGVGTLLAFGPRIWIAGAARWSPYELIAGWVPGLASIRRPGTFLVLPDVGMALLAGLGAGRLLERRPRWVAWLAAAACVALVLRPRAPAEGLPLHDEGLARPSDAYRWLAAHGDGHALLEVPRAATFTEAARRMAMSTAHWLPIVEGYSGYPPRSDIRIYSVAAGLPAEPAVQALADTVDVGWILVHRDLLEPEQRVAWSDSLPDGLTRAGEWGGDLLLRFARPPRNDRRSLLLSATRTMAGASLAPLSGPCPGQIRVAGPLPDAWPSGRRQVVSVEIENASDAVWPAFSLIPRHSVRLVTTLVRRGDAPFTRAERMLNGDVAPHSRVALEFGQEGPTGPGDYVLRMELVQMGDAPLSGCGVAPIEVPLRVVAAAKPIAAARP